jgi:hypothetical protein
MNTNNSQANPSADTPGVKTFQTASAEGFLSNIHFFLGQSAQFKTSPGSRFFRGCLAEHDLKPSLERTDTYSFDRLKLVGTEDLNLKDHSFPNNAGIRFMMFRKAITRFYRQAVLNGFQLPQIEPRLHQLMMVSQWQHIQISQFFDDARSLQLIALAQHVGIPTPLLDWTEDLYVAIYFASKSALKRILESDETDKEHLTSALGLAIWVMPEEFLYDTFRSGGLVDEHGQIHAPDYPYKILVVSPLRHYNPNLTAQKGKFTLMYKSADLNAYTTYLDLPPIEKIWQELLNAVKQAKTAIFKNIAPDLMRLTAPLSAAPAIMRYLRMNGYDGARLFPSLEGCVSSLEEEFLIRQAEEKLKSLGITP